MVDRAELRSLAVVVSDEWSYEAEVLLTERTGYTWGRAKKVVIASVPGLVDALDAKKAFVNGLLGGYRLQLQSLREEVAHLRQRLGEAEKIQRNIALVSKGLPQLPDDYATREDR